MLVNLWVFKLIITYIISSYHSIGNIGAESTKNKKFANLLVNTYSFIDIQIITYYLSNCRKGLKV